MTYDEFVKAYVGKATDYDGAYGAQCVDFIKLYLDKVFGIRAGAWGDAKLYWLHFKEHTELVKAFNRIENTPKFVPQKGDIVVWSGEISKSNDCGHVAIATGDGTTSWFKSYDQNWGEKAAREVKHRYKAVYGVLRPKDQSKITSVRFFKRYTGGSSSIAQALNEIGEPSGYTYRAKIAKANGITGYLGTAKQNMTMLSLLKAGKLIKP